MHNHQEKWLYVLVLQTEKPLTWCEHTLSMMFWL